MFPATAADSSTVQLLTGAELLAGLAPTPEYGDQRVLDGFGYTVSTAITAVAAGNYLSCELVNPSGSGLNFIMAARVLSASVATGNAPLEYSRYVSTATLPGTPTAVTIGNRISGGVAAPTGSLFRYVMATSLPTGTVSSGGFIPTGGEEKRIKDIVIIPPGGKLVYATGGSGGGLAAAARVAMTFLFYTRPI